MFTCNIACLFVVLFFSPFRRARVTFDTSETQKVFGPIVIDYHQVYTITFCLDQKLNTYLGLEQAVSDGINPCEALPYNYEVRDLSTVR